jgi:hypothetical protein
MFATLPSSARPDRTSPDRVRALLLTLAYRLHASRVVKRPKTNGRRSGWRPAAPR